MLRRKTTIIAALVTMLASSVIGASALRAGDARATDALELADGALDAVQEIGGTVGEVSENALEVAPPVLTGGVGETLVLVIAAQVPAAEGTALLEKVNASFGELQGFSIDDAANYQLTGLYVREGAEMVEVACAEDVGCPGGISTALELQPVQLRHVPLDAVPSIAPSLGAFGFLPGHSILVSGFRTKRGAEEFVDLARAVGLTDLTVVQARKLGGGDVGLGQEPHPDGSGPLLGPLADQDAYQR